MRPNLLLLKNIFMFQLLILADILMESSVVTNKGPVIIPIQKLSEKKKKNISEIVSMHLGTLLALVDKNKPS